jgi:hypothetical protein
LVSFGVWEERDMGWSGREDYGGRVVEKIMGESGRGKCGSRWWQNTEVDVERMF